MHVHVYTTYITNIHIYIWYRAYIYTGRHMFHIYTLLFTPSHMYTMHAASHSPLPSHVHIYKQETLFSHVYSVILKFLLLRQERQWLRV